MQTPKLNLYLDQLTSVLVTIIADLGPWLTPLAPMYIVARSLITRFDIPPLVAWLSASALETVGISALYTTVTLYQYALNRRHRDPVTILWPTLGVIAVYLALALFLTVGVGESVYLSGFFALAICSYITSAVRVRHAYSLSQIEVTKLERKRERQKRQVLDTGQKVTRPGKAPGRTWRSPRGSPVRERILSTIGDSYTGTMVQLAKGIGVSRQTLYRYLDTLETEGLIDRGDGQIRLTTPVVTSETNRREDND